MNEEQKQAIKELKHFTNMTVFWKEKEYTSHEIDNCINIVLHLIDKQQKEIEELNIIKNSIQTLETNFVNDDTYYVIAKKNFLEGDFRHLLDDYISKDEIRHIRDKAECMDYYSLNDVIDDLSKLLGENEDE